MKDKGNIMIFDLVHNMMMDLRKKDIEPFDRANLIKAYMEYHSLSQRQLAQGYCVITKIKRGLI